MLKKTLPAKKKRSSAEALLPTCVSVGTTAVVEALSALSAGNAKAGVSHAVLKCRTLCIFVLDLRTTIYRICNACYTLAMCVQLRRTIV